MHLLFYSCLVCVLNTSFGPGGLKDSCLQVSLDLFQNLLKQKAFFLTFLNLSQTASWLKLSGVFCGQKQQKTDFQAVKRLTEQLFSFSAALPRFISDSVGLSASCGTASGGKLATSALLESAEPAVRSLFKMIGYKQAQFSPAVMWEEIPELHAAVTRCFSAVWLKHCFYPQLLLNSSDRTFRRLLPVFILLLMAAHSCFTIAF